MTPQQKSGLSFATAQYNRTQDKPVTEDEYLAIREDIMLDEMAAAERASKVVALTNLGAAIVDADPEIQDEIIAFAQSKLQ